MQSVNDDPIQESSLLFVDMEIDSQEKTHDVSQNTFVSIPSSSRSDTTTFHGSSKESSEPSQSKTPAPKQTSIQDAPEPVSIGDRILSLDFIEDQLINLPRPSTSSEGREVEPKKTVVEQTKEVSFNFSMKFLFSLFIVFNGDNFLIF